MRARPGLMVALLLAWLSPVLAETHPPDWVTAIRPSDGKVVGVVQMGGPLRPLEGCRPGLPKTRGAFSSRGVVSMSLRRRVQAVLPMLLLGLLACGPKPQALPPEVQSALPTPTGQEARPSPPQAEAPSTLELRMPVDVVRGTLVLQEGGEKWRLFDAARKPVAAFKVQPDRVKVKDATDREILKIKRKTDGGWEVEDAAGTRLLRAKRKDGGWKVSDGKDALVARVRVEGDLLRLEDGSGRFVTSARQGSGEVRFHGASGEEQGALRGVTDPQAAVWFMLPGQDPITQAALVVYSLEVK
jgi:hypothetical protein